MITFKLFTPFDTFSLPC